MGCPIMFTYYLVCVQRSRSPILCRILKEVLQNGLTKIDLQNIILNGNKDMEHFPIAGLSFKM